MKKILFLGLILTLFAAAASAQVTDRHRYRSQKELQLFRRNELTRPELRHLHRDEVRYKIARRKASRDGIITHAERRQLQKIKEHRRRELYRFRHNNHRRVI